MNAGRHRLRLTWLLLAVLVGLIVFIQFREDEGDVGDDGHGHAAAESKMLLSLPVNELGAIEIATDGSLHRFERDATGNWFYHGAHAAAVADHGHEMNLALSERINKVFAGLDNAKRERDAPYDKDKDVFGVVVPKIILIVYRPKESQPLSQIAVGDIAADGLSRYVHQIGSDKVYTLPEYHIQNLISAVRIATAPSLAVPLAPAQ